MGSLLLAFKKFFSAKKYAFVFPAVAFAMQYFYRLYVGQKFDGTDIGNDSLQNFLSTKSLSENPLEALWGLHTQPPLLNGLYAIAIQFQPHEDLIVQIIWALFGLVTIWCIYEFSIELLDSKIWAVSLSILYQLIPSTIGYTLWAYNTILIQALFAILALGILKISKLKIEGLYYIHIALLGLFLGRAPFAGLVIAPMILYFHWYLKTRTNSKNLTKKKMLGFSLIVIVFIQGHFLIDFKQIALSSWGGHSTLRALTNGVGQDKLLSQVGDDQCHQEIIRNHYQGQSISAFPSCISRYDSISIRTTKAAEVGNKNNSKEALLASIATGDLAKKLVVKNILSYENVVFGSNDKLGTFQYFMGEAKFKRYSIAYFKENILFLLTILLILILILFCFCRRRSLKSLSLELKSIILLIGYAMFYSLVTEILENDRYKIEANSLYFLCSIAVVFYLMLNSNLKKYLMKTRPV